MSFIIKQNSTLPEFEYQLTQRILEKYGISEEMLENCAVTFSMIDISTGKYVISNVAANLTIYDDRYTFMHKSKYVLSYKFKLNQTKKIGIYRGEFKLDLFDNGKYTFTGYDDFNINIIKSFTKTTVTNVKIEPTIIEVPPIVPQPEQPLPPTPVSYYYLFGKVASNGAIAGANRPTADTDLLGSGTQVEILLDQIITITYNSTSDDYIWFAIPSVFPNRTKWYVNDFNQGDIGGIIDDGGNLFPDPIIVANYKVYIANYQTIVNSIQIRRV